MTGRYDATGNVEAQFEPGSDGRVLANKLAIADPKEMDDIELYLLNRLHKDVTSSVKVDQPITVADLREWHHRWLGKVYVWAGRDRSVEGNGQASVTRGFRDSRRLIFSSMSRTDSPVSIAVELATLRIRCRAAFSGSRR